MIYTYNIKKYGDIFTDIFISGFLKTYKVIYKDEYLSTVDINNVELLTLPFWINLLPILHHDVKLIIDGVDIKIKWKYVLIKDNFIRQYLCFLKSPIIYIENQIEVSPTSGLLSDKKLI